MDSDSVHETLDTTPEADRPPQPGSLAADSPVEKNEVKQEPSPQHNSAGTIVLQWLSYAFWGWLIVGLLWLMGIVLVNALLGESTNETLPYALAASIVVLPLAFIADLFYRKKEPVRKTGAAMVIMTVHAVLYAILGITALIIAVFTVVNALLNTGLQESHQVTLYTALFATVLYALVFVRIINPFKAKKPVTIYGLAMLILTIVMLTLAIVGPFTNSVATRGDRAIENGLPYIQTSIDSYFEENKKLPKSLDDINLNNEDAKDIVGDNKVEYKPETKDSTTDSLEPVSGVVSQRYQLCVEYKGAKGDKEARNDAEDSKEVNYINTYAHNSGKVCYKLEASTSLPWSSYQSDEYYDKYGY